MVRPLVSAPHEVDEQDANDYFQSRGWTDGLPIVPPTEARVRRFLDAADRDPGEEIGFYNERKRPVTVEKLAINAVMAGCAPEHFPIVIAIAEAMLAPGFGLHVANASTGGAALAYIVNGPVRQRLRMSSGGNVLGPGNRANSTIGRAIRLVQMNVMGSSLETAGGDGDGDPGLDRSIFGQPGKYACYHLVENEEAFPQLVPLHVERGFERGDSTVTVFMVAGHMQINTAAEGTQDEWIATMAQYVVGVGRLDRDGDAVVVIAPESAEMFVRNGWSKRDIREALYEASRRSVAWVKREGWKVGGRNKRGDVVVAGDEDDFVGIAGGPDRIHLLVAGGTGNAFVVYLYPYATHVSRAVTQKIRVPAP